MYMHYAYIILGFTLKKKINAGMNNKAKKRKEKVAKNKIEGMVNGK